MKKIYLLATTVIALLLTSCSKEEFHAQYVFVVSDEMETKAVFNGHNEKGPDITWEEGDNVRVTIEVYDPNHIPMKEEDYLDLVNGKCVYESGKWETYVAQGESFVKTDCFSVRSPMLGSMVSMHFFYENGSMINNNKDYFCTGWNRSELFTEGRQTIEVKLPFVEN